MPDPGDLTDEELDQFALDHRPGAIDRCRTCETHWPCRSMRLVRALREARQVARNVQHMHRLATEHQQAAEERAETEYRIARDLEKQRDAAEERAAAAERARLALRDALHAATFEWPVVGSRSQGGCLFCKCPVIDGHGPNCPLVQALTSTAALAPSRPPKGGDAE